LQDSVQNGVDELEEVTPSIIRQIRRDLEISVVEVVGDVDLSTAPQLKEALTQATDAGQDVIVDLRAVTYMDSSGFGTLLGATKRLRPVGSTVYLVGANPNIERMLEITRLSTILSLQPSEEAARRAIAEENAAADVMDEAESGGAQSEVAVP
jgi:anti-anti-sigma factor